MAEQPKLPQQHMLDVRQLCVSFGSGDRQFHAVKSLSLHLDRGETLAIVGESGSGKSVTSLALMRLVEFAGGSIDSGELIFQCADGTVIDLRRANEDRMRRLRGAELGMIFQEPMTSLNPVFTVGAQIREAILLHQDLTHAQATSTTRRTLDQVRIADSAAIMGRYPHELSGGMRQRIMIAMALSCKPSVLIADEPTTALDVTIQAQILVLLKELQKELDMGIIFITHDMGVVAEIADRVMVMRQGEVVEHNQTVSLFAQPVHPYTKMLLAAVPILGSMRGTQEPRRLMTEDSVYACPDLSPLIEVPSRADQVVLSVKNLVTRFDIKSGFFSRIKKRVHAVEQVSFELHQGETLSLVGESGCGKTTIGRSIVGLTKILHGAIEFDGRHIRPKDTSAMLALRRNIQFVFQDPFASLNPRMKVGECIKEPMLIQNLASGVQATRQAAALMERVGLDPSSMGRWPHEFSGGQRQRICIARALSVRPRVLIADESVSALDVSIRAQIVNLLIDLQRELGIAYLFISHDMAVVERISHRIAVMYLGQIAEIGPRHAIFENPQHPYTRKLIQAVPIADPTCRRKVMLDLSEIPSPIRSVGEEPVVAPLVDLGGGHFVARHRIGGQY